MHETKAKKHMLPGKNEKQTFKLKLQTVNIQPTHFILVANIKKKLRMKQSVLQ